jgi:hypothetical protein
MLGRDQRGVGSVCPRACEGKNEYGRSEHHQASHTHQSASHA